MIDKTTSNEVS